MRKLEPVRLCGFYWCQENVHAKGLCAKHYAWERWHLRHKHGHEYWNMYVDRHRELGDRGAQKLVPVLVKRRA